MRSKRVDYEQIQHLVSNLTVDTTSSHLSCNFVCPQSGVVVPARAKVRSGLTLKHLALLVPVVVLAIPLAILDYQLSKFTDRLRWNVFGKIKGFFGGGMIGNAIAGSVVDPYHRPNNKFVPPPPNAVAAKEVQAALVEAFESVKGNFVEGPEGWVAHAREAEIESDFLRRLSRQPVVRRLDREVALRLLKQLAKLGGIRREEKEFLALFSLTGRAPDRMPSMSDLRGVSPEAGESIIGLCWALSLVDGELGSDEEELIRSTARTFGLTEQSCEDIHRQASEFVLSVAQTTVGGAEEQAELTRLAERLGRRQAGLEP